MAKRAQYGMLSHDFSSECNYVFKIVSYNEFCKY